MPLLAGLLVSLASGFAAFFTKYVTQKIAVGLAAVATIATLLAALLLLMRTTISPLAAAMFSTSYGSWAGLAFPPIAGTCLAAVVTTWSACTLYAWQKHALDAFLKA
jgi:hypothetical protein